MASMVSTADGEHALLLRHWHDLPPPVFILAAPRSFTSVVCAMLGQHPQMYGLPEAHLFCDDTVGKRNERARNATYPMGHGLLRAVAELFFGAQTVATIHEAERWLSVRDGFTTDFLFKVLADRLFPRIPVDKSPSTIRTPALQRIRQTLPTARFIHLVRHPRGHAESVMKYIGERSRHGPMPTNHWLFEISSRPVPNGSVDHSSEERQYDPQYGWLELNDRIHTFLETVPPALWLRIRGEDLLAAPDDVLPRIAGWLGVRGDAAAIEEMKHPERSPYAFVGPPGARWGNDAFFLRDPMLRPGRAVEHSLEGALPWRKDGQGFSPEVSSLAQLFGYR